MRLAIAEDSGLFRSSLTLLLEASGAQVTASAASGPELLEAIGISPPDAVILDIRMPPSFTDEGINTAAEVRRLYPRVGVLVLSTYAETSYASQLLETVPSGVGYLLKDNVTDARTLMESLARIAAGETVIDPAIVRRLLERNRKPNKIDLLNERERAVLSHMAEGRSNLGIANELFLSPRTVEAHVTSIFVKLELDQAETDNNRVRAVLAFLRSADAGSLLKDDHVFFPERDLQIVGQPTYGEGRDDLTMTRRPAGGGGRRAFQERHADVKQIMTPLAGNGRGGRPGHRLPRFEDGHHHFGHPQGFRWLPTRRRPLAGHGGRTGCHSSRMHVRPPHGDRGNHWQ
jgi:DNA-binding NarL/FixJ family response regulator